MSEINSLISQVQQLGGSVDTWERRVHWSMVLTVIIGVLYLGATLRQSFLSKKLRGAQTALDQAKDRSLANDLKSKDVEIENTKGAAAEADRQAGIAKKAAGHANERAASLEKEAANARQRTEKLQNQNLATEAKLESERRTRLELEESLAPRITPLKKYSDGTTNVDTMRPLAGSEITLEYLQDAEAGRAAGNLNFLLEQAGLKIVRAGPTDAFMWDGVTVEQYMPPDPVNPEENIVRVREQMAAAERAHIIVDCLEENGWEVRLGYSRRGELAPDQIRVRVGFKSNPYFDDSTIKEMRARIKVKRNRGRSKPIVEQYLLGLEPPKE